MERISPLSRTCLYLGNKVNERFRLFFEEVVGTSVLAPMVIASGIGGPKDQRSKDERSYQALRQPISGLLKIATALALIIPVGRKIVNMAIIGRFPEYMNSALKINIDKLDGHFDKLLEKLDTTKKLPIAIQAQLKETFDFAKFLKSHDEKITALQKTGKTVGTPSKFEQLMTSIATQKGADGQPNNMAKAVSTFREKYHDKIQNLIIKLNKNKIIANHLPESLERLKAESELFKYNSSEILRNLLTGETLSKQQKKSLDELVIKEHTQAFQAGKQVIEWFISLILTPISAYLLNVAYPPFVNKIAPNLADRINKRDRL